MQILSKRITRVSIPIFDPKIKVLHASSLLIILLLIGRIALPQGFAQSQRPIPGPGATTADFYVATNGDDSAPGRISQPFRTVDHARLAVQTLKSQVSGRTITVFIRNGT